LPGDEQMNKINYTHTTNVTIVSMRGSLGILSATFEVAGTKKLDGPLYLDDIITEAYSQILKPQNVEVVAVSVNIGGIYSEERFHRYVCNVSVSGKPENGPIGRITDELHIYVDRNTFSPIIKD